MGSHNVKGRVVQVDICINVLLEEIMKKLTTREKEVLQWIASGKTAWEISKILNIAERTVNFHSNNAKEKFNVATRSQAVVEALRRGLID